MEKPIFINVRIDRTLCAQASSCQLCVQKCPVEIFQLRDGLAITNEENEDECTLCDICVEACPRRAIQVIKLYED